MFQTSCLNQNLMDRHNETMDELKYTHELHGNIRVFFTTWDDLEPNSVLLRDLEKLNITPQLRAVAHGCGTTIGKRSKATIIHDIRIAAIERGSNAGDQDCVDISTWFPSRDKLEKFLSSDKIKMVTDKISGRISSEGNQAVNLSGENRVFVDPNLALFAGSHLKNDDDLFELYDFVCYPPSGIEEGKIITKEIVEVMDPILRESGASKGLTSAKPTSFNVRNSCYLIKVNDLVTINIVRHPDTAEPKNPETHTVGPRTQEKNLDQMLATNRKVHGADLEVIDVLQFRYSKHARDFGKILRLLLGNSFLEVDRGSELVSYRCPNQDSVQLIRVEVISYRCPDQDSVQLIQEEVTRWFELTLVRDQRRGRKHCVQFYNEETLALFGPSDKG